MSEITNVKISKFFAERIESLVNTGKYVSIAEFVRQAVREKLDTERHIIEIRNPKEKEACEA